MNKFYNIYCDESCHLENDGKQYMVLGAVWCPVDKAREIAVKIREIKSKHDVSVHRELKWSKVSPAKIDMYLDLIDYFFDNNDLYFRGLVADKSILNHGQYNQDHDEWYYKMYFSMLKVLFERDSRYYIYMDIKDTLGGERINTLTDVLRNSQYDFSHEIIQRLQIVQSHHIEQLQIADLLIGALSYLNNVMKNTDQLSSAKVQLIDQIKQRSKYTLTKNTFLREQKFNLFYWKANGVFS